MAACAICLDALRSPIALPCGHVYCHDCISSLVKEATSLATTKCPTCRTPFPLIALNPYLVPANLRPYILPPFRRIYLNEAPTPERPDSPIPSTAAAPPKEDAETQQLTARLQAENAVLRKSCLAWRQRADAHATSHVGLAALVRMAKEQAQRMCAERDELARKYEAMKRKLSEYEEEEDDGDDDDDALYGHDGRDEIGPLFSKGIWSPRTIPHAVPGESHAHDAPLDYDEARRATKRRKLWTDDTIPKSPIPAMIIPHAPRPELQTVGSQ